VSLVTRLNTPTCGRTKVRESLGLKSTSIEVQHATMSLHFTTPKANVNYRTKALDSCSALYKKHIEDVQALLAILPKGDELCSYDAPLENSLKNADWHEEGVAVVRDGKVIVLVKLGEYHDCGIY